MPEIRLIDETGKYHASVRTEDAIKRAQDVSLDLILISPPTEQPPLYKMVNYGRDQFARKKKSQKQKSARVKEVKFRPTTDVGDYKIKLRKIIQFLDSGDKVKVSLRFRGREIQHRDIGLALLNRLKGDLTEYSIEQEPKLEGRQMTMVVMKGKNNAR